MQGSKSAAVSWEAATVCSLQPSKRYSFNYAIDAGLSLRWSQLRFGETLFGRLVGDVDVGLPVQNPRPVPRPMERRTGPVRGNSARMR